MATVGQLVTQVQILTQDEDASAWDPTTVATQLLREIEGIARKQVFGNIRGSMGSRVSRSTG